MTSTSLNTLANFGVFILAKQMSQLTLANLPQDPLHVLISKLPDLEDVINLYYTNPNVYQALSCTTQPDSRNDLFVKEARYCPLTSQQTQLLTRLVNKFHLDVPSPITFPKIIRAYYRSAYNPQCPDYGSLADCFESAARSGQIQQFLPPTADTVTLRDTYFHQAGQLPREVRHNEALAYNNLLLRSAITAYENRQVPLGDELSKILQRSSYQMTGVRARWLTFVRFKAWLKILLAPYKLLTSKQIRQLHAGRLFASDVGDTEKQKLWAQQYDTSNLDLVKITELAQEFPGVDEDMVNAILIKLGLNEQVQLVALDMNTYYLIGQSGDQEWIENLLLDSDDIDRVLMMYFQTLKRGYWDAAQLFKLGEPFELTLESTQHYSILVDNLKNFTYEQLKLFNQGLLDQKLTTEADLLRPVLWSNNYSWYTQYVTENSIDLEKLAAILPDTVTTLRGINIINDVLESVSQTLLVLPSGEITAGLVKAVSEWLGYNYPLLVNIWKQLGRRQLEDSVIYLRTHLKVATKPELLMIQAITSESPGLLAYTLGYQLTLDGELLPLTGGLFQVKKDILAYFWVNNKSGYVNRLAPDMIKVVNDLIT